MKNLLILVTGSVAAIKLKLLINEFKSNFNLKVAITNSAINFIKDLDIDEAIPIYKDSDEWNTFNKIGDDILHIELRRWSDIVIIAPLSANTLAKISNGLADNLVTSIIRALDDKTPVHVFPSMNSFMYSNPLTERQLDILKNVLHFNIHGPISKLLACGDQG